ncbi:hypothetical protein LEMLEM_LOCUS25490 [Lemmus lemmus]
MTVQVLSLMKSGMDTLLFFTSSAPLRGTCPAVPLRREN